METNVSEKIFHDDGIVLVTQSRFVADGKTYAMRNIASVAVFKLERSRKFEMALLILGAILLVGDDTRVAGFILILSGFVIYGLRKDKYSARIHSNSGESDGFVSPDKNYIERIVAALNDAIVHRG